MSIKKKKEHFLSVEKKRNNVLCFGKKSKHYWHTICCKNTFVCFQNKTGKAWHDIPLPRTVNKDFFWQREKNTHTTQMPRGYFNRSIPLTTQQLTDEAMLRITSKQKKSYSMRHRKGFSKHVDKFSRSFKILFGYLNKFESWHKVKHTL